MGKYHYRIHLRELSLEEGGGWLAEVPELPGCITDGESPVEALAGVDAAIQSWIEAAAEFGEEIPASSPVPVEYSGKFTLRLPRSMHRILTEAAEADGVSLNQYLVFLLAERNATHKRQPDLVSVNYHDHTQISNTQIMITNTVDLPTPNWYRVIGSGLSQGLPTEKGDLCLGKESGADTERKTNLC